MNVFLNQITIKLVNEPFVEEKDLIEGEKMSKFYHNKKKHDA